MTLRGPLQNTYLKPDRLQQQTGGRGYSQLAFLLLSVPFAHCARILGHTYQ
jgi:hypothetical protein